MTSFEPELLRTAAWCALAAFLVLVKPWGARVALVLAVLRIAVPFLHFRYELVDVQAWRLLDDVKYVEEAEALGGAVLSGAQGATDQLFATAEGHHVGFYLCNILAQALFGPTYYAAVFANVVLTCVAARGLLRLLALVGVERRTALATGAFFLLHWDVIAWSSFFNMKDPVVLTLTVWLFVHALELAVRPRLRALAGFLLLSGLLYFFRWYVPLLVAGGVGAWGVLALAGWRRNALLALGLVALVLVPLHGDVPTELLRPAGLADGFFKFALTPRPWGMAEGYRFLLFPASLHWLLAPVAIAGALDLWRRYPRARPVLCYLVLLFAFYAVVPRLHGPRHRFQCAFALAWLQFHGFHEGLRRAFARPARAPLPAAAGGAA